MLQYLQFISTFFYRWRERTHHTEATGGKPHDCHSTACSDKPVGHTTGYSRSLFPADRNVYSTTSSQRLGFIQPNTKCLLGVLTPEAKVVRSVKMTIYIHFKIRSMPGTTPPFPLFRNCRFDRVWKVATQGQLIGNRSHVVGHDSVVLTGSKCYCWFNIKCHREAVSLMLIWTVHYNIMIHQTSECY